MDLSDRLAWLLLGCVIGFVLGYIVRGLREIKERLDDVDIKKSNRNDDGFITLRNMALFLVVALTAFSAFQSQRATNKVNDTQAAFGVVSDCNQKFLEKTISALNERTTYSRAQAQANVELQKAQVQYLKIFFLVPPPNRESATDAFRVYFTALGKYVDVAGKTVDKQNENPYPTRSEYSSCLGEED